MESAAFKPDQGYKSEMFIIWTIVTAVIVLFFLPFILFIPDIEGKIVFGALLTAGLVAMALTALWIPAYYRTLEYSIDEDAVRMSGGVFWKRNVTVPYKKITNVDISQGPVQRMYDIGTVHVQTAGAGGAEGGRAEIRIVGVRDTGSVRDRVLENMGGMKKEPQPSTSIPGQTNGSQHMDAATLGKILDELTAVRRLLEQRERS